MRKWAIWFWVGLVLFAGCTTRTLEIDAKLGVKKDGGSGFFAYFTAPGSKPVESIKVFLASEDSILKPRVTVGDQRWKIYPIWVEDTKRVFVRPADLARILDAEVALPDSSRSTVELGYFFNAVYSINSYPSYSFENMEKVFPNGFTWASPKEKVEKKIQDAMQECVLTAARYGADAIDDVVVFYGKNPIGEGTVYGIWLYAKAVVYVEE